MLCVYTQYFHTFGTDPSVFPNKFYKEELNWIVETFFICLGIGFLACLISLYISVQFLLQKTLYSFGFLVKRRTLSCFYCSPARHAPPPLTRRQLWCPRALYRPPAPQSSVPQIAASKLAWPTAPPCLPYAPRLLPSKHQERFSCPSGFS